MRVRLQAVLQRIAQVRCSQAPFARVSQECRSIINVPILPRRTFRENQTLIGCDFTKGGPRTNPEDFKLRATVPDDTPKPLAQVFHGVPKDRWIRGFRGIGGLSRFGAWRWRPWFQHGVDFHFRKGLFFRLEGACRGMVVMPRGSYHRTKE